MIIAGLNFRLIKGALLYNCSGVLIYKHKVSNKCFVRALKNCRQQRSKNNFPSHLKEYLKVNPSEVVIYLGELPKCTKEALYMASRTVSTELSERGLLFKEEKTSRSIYRQLNGEEALAFTVWSMTHKTTGAVFFFHEEKGVDPTARMEARLRTFNNYVEKGIVNANRAMHEFAKAQAPLKMDDWVVRDLEQDLVGERAAKAYVTNMSKKHLDSCDTVLNRICDTDALYYRNHVMRLNHLGMKEYLKLS